MFSEPVDTLLNNLPDLNYLENVFNIESDIILDNY